MNLNPWKIHNPDGTFRVIVTKTLPGRQWLDILTAAGLPRRGLPKESGSGHRNHQDSHRQPL
jgi:hypothetical protein